MQMVYAHIEAELSKEEDPDAQASRELAEEEERLLQGGSNDYPATLACSLSGLHATNIIAVACWPGQPRFFTGAGACRPDPNLLGCNCMPDLMTCKGGGIMSLPSYANVYNV